MTCQAKLKGENVSRDSQSSAISEYIANLAKEISRQNAEDANWLILVVYAKEKGAEKEVISFQAKFRGNTGAPK